MSFHLHNSKDSHALFTLEKSVHFSTLFSNWLMQLKRRIALCKCSNLGLETPTWSLNYKHVLIHLDIHPPPLPAIAHMLPHNTHSAIWLHNRTSFHGSFYDRITMCTHSHILKFQLTVTPLGVLKKTCILMKMILFWITNLYGYNLASSINYTFFVFSIYCRLCWINYFASVSFFFHIPSFFRSFCCFTNT